MDVLYFLERRTAFIRNYYETTVGAFADAQRKIEAGEPPFDNPPWDESGEPPYQIEWSEAAEGRIVAGRSCISLLKIAMHAFFKAWERELSITMDDKERKKIFARGILHGYRHVFEYFTKTDWNDSGVDLELLEQVILARNADQHEGDITTVHAAHPAEDRSRFRRLFFIGEDDRTYLEADEDPNDSSFSWAE